MLDRLITAVSNLVFNNRKVLLVVFGILENFGYRQMNSLFKVKAFWDTIRRRRAWGQMQRKGFQGTATGTP